MLRTLKDEIVSAVAGLFDGCREIAVTAIPFSEEMRRLCEQNDCGNYGRNWTCPPAVQSLADFRPQLASFDTFLVVYRVYEVAGSFDWQGMMRGVGDFQDRLRTLKKKLGAALPPSGFLVLGAGGCLFCKTCAYINGKPCVNPEETIVSVEACGIDVLRMMVENGVRYYHGENTVTYIGGVFLRS
jgi:predicted metal-binding protein